MSLLGSSLEWSLFLMPSTVVPAATVGMNHSFPQKSTDTHLLLALNIGRGQAVGNTQEAGAVSSTNVKAV